MICLTALVLQAATSLSQVVPVGGIARPFTITNLETGQPIRLEDFAGKVLLLDFFAYWCGPCQRAMPDMETNIQQYYHARGGNANGVPVQCLAVSIDDSNPTATNDLIERAGVDLAGEDPLTATGAWNQFNVTGGIPFYVIINCVDGSPSHAQWEVLYKQTGYAGAPALRAVIDRVMPGRPNEPEITVEGPDGDSIRHNSTTVEMGSVMVGSSGSEKTFTIRNTGRVDLSGISVSIAGANPGEFTINTGQTASVLSPGGRTTFKATFSPAASGIRRAVIQINSNDSDENPFKFNLEGTGLMLPELEVRSRDMVLTSGTSEIPFGYSLVDRVSEERSIVISNIGNAPLTGISALILGAHPFDFEMAAQPPASIAPGASVTLTLRFTPSEPASRESILRIISNDSDESPFEIALVGVGTGVSQNVPIIRVYNGAESLDYGSAVVSFGTGIVTQTVIERTISIGNLGNASLTRLYASIGGANSSDFEIVGSLAFTVEPGETSSITVRFRPSAAGTRAGSLRITSNDANQNPFDIQLAGIGQLITSGPEIVVTQGTGVRKNLIHGKSTRNLGSSRLGRRGKVMSFQVKNTGTDELGNLRASLFGKQAKEFVLVRNLTIRSLAPGKSAIIKVAFSPLKAGTRSTTLRVFSNDSDESPFVVELVGIGKLR